MDDTVDDGLSNEHVYSVQARSIIIRVGRVDFGNMMGNVRRPSLRSPSMSGISPAWTVLRMIRPLKHNAPRVTLLRDSS